MIMKRLIFTVISIAVVGSFASTANAQAVLLDRLCSSMKQPVSL